MHSKTVIQVRARAMALNRLFIYASRSAGTLTSLINLLTHAANSIYDVKKSLAIFGTSRSGTTWLAELLLSLPRYRLIYEPLNPDFYPYARRLIRRLGFCHRRLYVHIHEENIELFDYLYNVLKGRVQMLISPMFLFNELWKAKRSVVPLKGVIGFPLIKFVNGIRLLPWFARNFKIRGMYMIIRHPCAVIESQLSTFGRPKASTEVLKKILLHDVLKIKELLDKPRIIRKLGQISSYYEFQAALWALDYYVPLCYQIYRWWYTVVYERLVLDSVRELNKIFSYIEEKVPKNAYLNLRKFSITSREKGYVKDPYHVLNKWKKKFSKEDNEKIMNVLDWFEMNFYSIHDPEPDYKMLFSWRC